MKIVFFSHYFKPEGNAPASRTYEHCKQWATLGHKVTVITSVPNVPNGIPYDGWTNKIWPQREIVDGIEVYRVWTYLAPNSGNFRRTINYLSYMFSALICFIFFCNRPDVLIATSPQFFCGWAGVFGSWLKWCPLILEVRDIWPDSIVTVGAMKRSLLIRVLESLEVMMYKSARMIVTVTDGLKKDIVGKVPGTKRIHVVKNGVDLAQFPNIPPNRNLLQKWDISNEFVCSYVGTIGLAHGLKIVIESAEHLKETGRRDLIFLMVGDGADRENLELETKRKDLGDWIKFTGRIDKEMIPQMLVASDAILIHLKKNKLFESAIPSKLFEAMAMNKPVVLGVQGEAEAIVRQADCGIAFEPEDCISLIQAIDRMVEDPALKKKLGLNGRDFVSQHFSRVNLAKNFLAHIETL